MRHHLEEVLWVMLMVVIGAILIAVIVLAALQERRPPDFDAEIPPDAEVIYTERGDGNRGTRVLVVDGCALTQEWDYVAFSWYLSKSRAGGFGGTRGIPAVDCGATP